MSCVLRIAIGVYHLAHEHGHHHLWRVGTGWHIRLFKTSRWNWWESCVLLYGPYTKTQLSNQCQWEVLNKLNGHPVLYLNEHGWERKALLPSDFSDFAVEIWLKSDDFGFLCSKENRWVERDLEYLGRSYSSGNLRNLQFTRIYFRAVAVFCRSFLWHFWQREVEKKRGYHHPFFPDATRRSEHVRDVRMRDAWVLSSEEGDWSSFVSPLLLLREIAREGRRTNERKVE